MKLILANKAYSSWSFRPWLVMKQFGFAFEELVIPMYLPQTPALMRPYTPNGKLPVLVDGTSKIYESLAIIEYLHEIKPVWPKDKAARAHARSIANEMHASFHAMRDLLTCNFRRAPKKLMLPAAVQQDVNRILAIWQEARETYGQNDTYGEGGAFLYGEFSAADAMYAPVVSRFYAYGVDVPAFAKTYMHTMMALPAWKEWEKAGQNEEWIYASYDRD